MPLNLRTESLSFYKTPAKANLFGVPLPDKTILFNHFLGDILTDEWAPSGDNGGTEAITAGSGGKVTCTTGATLSDRSILASELNWYANKNCGMFAKVKLSSIAAISAFVGFSDAKTEANDLIQFSYSGTTLTDTASDAAGWLFDTDSTNDYWNMVNTAGNTEAVQETTTAPVADTYAIVGVTFKWDGTSSTADATFWYNGAQVGFKASAITAATALTPILAVINRTTAAKVLSTDWILVYQDAE